MTANQAHYLVATSNGGCKFQDAYRAITRSDLFDRDALETVQLMDGADRYDALFAALMGLPSGQSSMSGGGCESDRIDDPQANLDLTLLTWLAYDGIAVRGLQQHAPRLGELARSHQPVIRTRRAVVRGLVMLGASSQAEALAASLDPQQWDRHLEAMVLGALHHWDSDAAIPYCMGMLSGNNGAQCALYLAQRNHRDALERIAFRGDSLGVQGLLARSMLGHRPSLAAARREFESNGQAETLVAMINLGDRSGTRQFARVFDGGNFLNIGYLAFLKDRAARQAAVTYLRSQSSARADRNAESKALAAVIRLQLGDRSAIPEIRTVLRGGERGARQKVMAALGFAIMDGSWDLASQGTGLVVAPELAPDLRYVFDLEADSRPAAGPLWAMAHNAR